jgi:dTDP-4-amino-4,6-dideoxygalactose transaminase
MLSLTGMRVIHIDVDYATLHMDVGMLDDCLGKWDAADIVLLVDHTFGYPDTAVSLWRRKYPDLLIIEDCVRALGAEVDGRFVGHIGDVILLSLYKTTLGNHHGALLLTRRPYDVRIGPRAAATFLEWASAVRTARFFYEVIKRGHCHEPHAPTEPKVSWRPDVASPSSLCEKRFARQLRCLIDDRNQRLQASLEIQSALQGEESLQSIYTDPSCTPSAFFLTYVLPDRIDRDAFVRSLHRKGAFLAWAWNVIPAHIANVGNSFPYGTERSMFIAKQICHIPLWNYMSSRRRRRLIDCFKAALRHGASNGRPTCAVAGHTLANHIHSGAEHTSDYTTDAKTH